MLSSVVPCLYVAVYAEAQRQNKDSKELGAAMAALMFNLIQLLRTLMGKVQLDTFVAWCKHAVECVRALLGEDDERNDQSEDRSNSDDVRDVNRVEMVENRVRLNNTVIDNELGGTDVTVLPSWKKMWDGLKRGEFNPRKWLEADLAALCTFRWCGAYLCGIGYDWGVPTSEARKELELFFSHETSDARGTLQCVTWGRAKENENSEVVSVKWLGDRWNHVDLRGETTTAYGSGITDYRVDSSWTAESYGFELDSLVSSYPESDSNREGVTVNLVHSVILAKHLGVETLKRIRRYYDRYKITEKDILRKALKLYIKQTEWGISDESEIFKMLCRGYSDEIPLFPYRMQLVALWEQETNWRVLQASAHADVRNSLWKVQTVLIPLHQIDSKPCSVFDYFSNIARSSFDEYSSPGCAGAVMESVRSFLAEWQMKTKQEAEWEPVVPAEFFEFDTPCNILNDNGDGHFDLDKRIIWVCLEALQREVTRISNGHQNLPSSNALIMLFLLGFPVLDMRKIEESEVGTRDSNTDICESKASTWQSHHSVNLSNQVWIVDTNLGAQDIWIEIRIDTDMQRCMVGLKKGSDVSRFVWQDWVDAAMGYMAGYNYRGGGKGEYERKIRRADLRDPMLALCPLRMNDEGRVIETSNAVVWMGWPPFDFHICKFEMEQWLKACDIDLATHRLVPDGADKFFWPLHLDEEIEQAERAIELVVFGQTEYKLPDNILRTL